jgi:hypothetical protein
MQRWTSAPLSHPAATYARADLEFLGVRHNESSFVVQLYLNNDAATAKTGRSEDDGFAAEFPVFAHGPCWTDEGHCDVRNRASAFDHTPEPDIMPINVSVTITDALRRVSPNGGDVTVTALAYRLEDENERIRKTDQILRFERLSLITYD